MVPYLDVSAGRGGANGDWNLALAHRCIAAGQNILRVMTGWNMYASDITCVVLYGHCATEHIPTDDGMEYVRERFNLRDVCMTMAGSQVSELSMGDLRGAWPPSWSESELHALRHRSAGNRSAINRHSAHTHTHDVRHSL